MDIMGSTAEAKVNELKRKIHNDRYCIATLLKDQKECHSPTDLNQAPESYQALIEVIRDHYERPFVLHVVEYLVELRSFLGNAEVPTKRHLAINQLEH